MLDALFPIYYPLIFVILLAGAVIWGYEKRKRDRNRKYWFIARREVLDPDNVTIAGPFDSVERSTLYLVKHPNIGIIMQAFQYQLPARDVKTAQALILNGAPYIREFRPELPDRDPSLN
ncbi:hypothetical protein [Dehalogenimonas alkenigignens]|uniref:hypothetical protein n=1 Tax=Dehalogenimonas alkenigignens TaxID=1217799 RepID=UPI000D5729B3|nr:hypothetical protein [Dehalogenimonas alkenigignens]PVV83509.1 hypothetical protein DD509_06680 [Dehalogenimonas alkenigignens]